MSISNFNYIYLTIGLPKKVVKFEEVGQIFISSKINRFIFWLFIIADLQLVVNFTFFIAFPHIRIWKHKFSAIFIKRGGRLLRLTRAKILIPNVTKEVLALFLFLWLSIWKIYFRSDFLPISEVRSSFAVDEFFLVSSQK